MALAAPFPIPTKFIVTAVTPVGGGLFAITLSTVPAAGAMTSSLTLSGIDGPTANAAFGQMLAGSTLTVTIS